jgi:hypothetical protein
LRRVSQSDSYPSFAWAESLPQKAREVVPMARMATLMQDEYTATFSECVLYLFPASLDAPFSHDWAQIYLYCCTQHIQKWQPDTCISTDVWQNELNSWQTRLLTDLRRDIYKKRREQLKFRMKAQKKQFPVETKAIENLNDKPIEKIQLQLFDFA